jgi:hypothetical protein
LKRDKDRLGINIAEGVYFMQEEGKIIVVGGINNRFLGYTEKRRGIGDETGEHFFDRFHETRNL